MKKIIMMLFLFAGLGFYANAQTKKPAKAQLPKPLVAKLNLTADQKTKIDAILKTKATKLDSLAAAQSDKKTQRLSKKAINNDAMLKVENVLTADQKKVYADFLLDKQEKAKGKKAGAAPAATPPVK